MKKGTNNRYGKKACKKVIRPLARKHKKKKVNPNGIITVTITGGACGMDMFDLGCDPW